MKKKVDTRKKKPITKKSPNYVVKKTTIKKKV